MDGAADRIRSSRAAIAAGRDGGEGKTVAKK
jgi:hypothetical protein